MINTSEILFKYLPLEISSAVNSLPDEILESINEIRLRINSPITVTLGNKNLFLNKNGKICKVGQGITATRQQLTECVSKLTQGSLYTCDDYIAQGFIPLPEGGRAGVCGKANCVGGVMRGFSEITSINLRLHRFLPNAAMELLNEFSQKGVMGTLVCSPPAMGKTTFLRSIAYLLSGGQTLPPFRVAVADERCELSAGMPQGSIMDVLTGVPKAHAISMLTRSMSPQIIICDEISALETEPVLEAQNTGVTLIASAHCKTPKELLHRGRMKQLLESGIFPLTAILDYDGGYNCRIFETEVLL